jgi:uncharacterized protein
MNPEFGIGWRHPHYAQVLEQQPDLGFLEVHSENFFAPGGAALATLSQARSLYPISLHGVGLALGSAVGVDEWHLEQLERLVRQIDPVRVSDHACFARGPFGAHTVHAADLLPIPFTADALNVMCANVQRVQDRLQRPLLVENLSAYIGYAQADMPETEFLNTLARRTGCGLLVDVNNIYVNALNTQKLGAELDAVQSCVDWLQAIHPQAVGELHVAGHVDCGDIVIDDHGSRVSEPVWRLYALAHQRFPQAATLVEWDTDVPALEVLLEELKHARKLAVQPAPEAAA